MATAPTIQHEAAPRPHRLPVVPRALVRVTVESLRLLAVVNGGVALMLSAYVGSAGAARSRDVGTALLWYLAGFVVCAVCLVGGQRAEVRLRHARPVWVLVVAVAIAAGLACFALGSVCAVVTLG